MSELYSIVCERLWEKIDFHRDKLDLKTVDLQKMFPYDQLAEKSPLIRELVAEVNEEFAYEMSEYQASWAIVKAMSVRDFDAYNKENKTTLSARK